MPDRLRDPSKKLERQYQISLALQAENNGGNVQAAPCLSLPLSWQRFLAHNENINVDHLSTPGLSPVVITSGMPKIMPATQQPSIEQRSSIPQSVTPAQWNAYGMHSLTQTNSPPALSSDVERQTEEPPTRPRRKPESLINFVQNRLSNSCHSIASVLTSQGSRASRWSKRLSFQSYMNSHAVGCDFCPEELSLHDTATANIALFLQEHGSPRSEQGLLNAITRDVHLGANVNERTILGESALYFTTGAGFVTTCDFLLAHGANVHSRTFADETIGRYAKRCYRSIQDNAARYARIKWALLEVKKHKMFDRPRKRQRFSKAAFSYFSQRSVPPPNGPSIVATSISQPHRTTLDSRKRSLRHSESSFDNISHKVEPSELVVEEYDVFNKQRSPFYDAPNSVHAFVSELGTDNDSLSIENGRNEALFPSEETGDLGTYLRENNILWCIYCGTSGQDTLGCTNAACLQGDNTKQNSSI